MWWFYLSLSSIFMVTFAELAQQRILNGKDSLTPRASLILTWGIQAVFALFFLFLTNKLSNITSFFYLTDLRLILVTTLISLSSGYMYFKSFQVKNISFSIILLSSSIPVSAILGRIFFNESEALTKIMGISLILFSIFLVNYKNAHFEKNHIYGLFSGMLLGVMYTIDKAVVSNVDPFIYTFWIVTILAIANLLIDPIKAPISIAKTYKKNKKLFKILFISCLGYYLYNVLTFSAYDSGGEVGRIDSVNNTYVFLIIAFEYFILKQKDGIKRKIIASIIAVTGIILLGFF